MNSDGLTRDLYPYVSPETVADSIDHLVKIDFIEVVSKSSVIGLYGDRPRRLMLTQKGNTHISRNRPVAGVWPVRARAMGLAGLVLWLPVSLIGVQHAALVGGVMMVTAATVAMTNLVLTRLGA